jgi:adenylate cyclase
MVGIVFKYGGTLDKFLGDGLMALFGVPFELPDAETRATLCALEMLASVRTFNERYKLAERGLPPLHIGVGIASGPVVAGNIGSEERMEYTVIGDTVNFAARLESLNRSLGTTIIVSEATQQALGGRLPVRKLPPLKVKGKKGTPPLYAVLVDQISAEDLARMSADVLSGRSVITAEATASSPEPSPEAAPARR